MSYSYINASDLADTIKAGQIGRDVAVVDVRDDDFVGGNIPGCQHIPTSEHSDRTFEQLVQTNKAVPKVVFHCMLSQSRGPKAAMHYSRELQNQNTQAKNKGQQPIDQTVYVLRGGFGDWQARNRSDPGLVENFDPDFWT